MKCLLTKFHLGLLCAVALLSPAAVAQNILEPQASIAGHALGEAIRHSRNAAIGQTTPIPVNIRERLKDFFSDDVFNRARFKIGNSGVASLARNTLFNENVGAITLDDVIVFRSERDARENHSLWAHELRHVAQYLEWGVNSFAVQYVRDAGRRVEDDAYAYQAKVDRGLSGNLGPGCSNGRQVVEDLYRSVLEREGEEAGIRHNTLYLNLSKMNTRQLVSAFAQSAEFLNRFINGRSPEQQVRALYKHILVREGEAAGVESNARALNSSGYAAVVGIFIHSPEYTSRFGDWSSPSSSPKKYCS